MAIKIIRNAIKCKNCGDVIESKYRHDYKECSCGSCFVDGGHDYFRVGAKTPGCFEDLSQVIEVTEEVLKAESEAKTETMRRSLSMQDTFPNLDGKTHKK